MVFFSRTVPATRNPARTPWKQSRRLLETNIPIFGICLGHQLLALASGANTVKMSHGHHGANHPVQDQDTRQVIITSQNHGFAVDGDSPCLNNLKLHSLYRCLTVPCRVSRARGRRQHSASRGTRRPVRVRRTVFSGLFDRFIDMMDKATSPN